MKSIFSEAKEAIRHRKAFVLAFVLLAVVMLVLVFSTGWFMASSQKATETSVYNVSEFYLREISAQTGRQMQNSLDNQIQNLEAAIHALHRESLPDKPALQDYILNMAKLYDFDFYAVVDEDGMAHTADGAFSGLSELEFLSEADFKEPQISINQTLGNENMIMIAAPIDGMEYQGKALSGCVVGINASTISAKISLQNDEDQIFSNVILVDGSYLVKTPHIHLKKNNNVFLALAEQADFPKENSVQQMQEDIQEGRSGIISYYLEGILHYTYYAPAEGTDWYFTTTIHYGTISKNVEAVRATITRNSMIQLFVVLLVVFCVLLIYFWQRRRNEILYFEKMQAEEGSKAKSRFLSNMSHDIRTPMNAILGFTDLALQHEADSDTRRIHEYLMKIRIASRHLLSLINDVLDMSRIESGKMELNIVPCSLPDILYGMEAIVQSQIQEKGQILQMDASHMENGNVCCDKLRLNQVLLNLVGNAIKFTPTGGTITMSVAQKGGVCNGYGSYEFRVKDNGMGMTPEFAKKVFEPFERESTSTVSGIQGTGLGMAITKNIIDLMGGAIRVETALDIGTEFIINVDFKIQDKSSEEGEDVCQKEPQEMDFSGRRILLVEDNELNREIGTEILRQYGFEVEVAEDGCEAVEKIQNAQPGQYHLVLMDVQMPIMDGYTATREIRELDSIYASVPIIAMTANAFEEDKREALECGMNGHISKPVDISVLLRVLADILK